MGTSLIGKALVFGPNEYGFESHVSKQIKISRNNFLLNSLEIATKKKYICITQLLTNKELKLLKLLKKKGVVRTYYYLNKNCYKIYLNANSTRSAHQQKIFFLKKRNPLFISVKALQRLLYNINTSFLVLETTKGFLTHTEAINKKVGGRLIAIYF